MSSSIKPTKEKKMRKLLSNMFTDGSNQDYDYAKILGAVAFAVFMVLSYQAYKVKDQPFEPITWTTAVGLLIGAASGASKIKDFTKPNKEE